MTLLKRTTMLALLILGLLPLTAQAWNRNPATTFARLPPGTAHPSRVAVTGSAPHYYGHLLGIVRRPGPALDKQRVAVPHLGDRQ